MNEIEAERRADELLDWMVNDRPRFTTEIVSLLRQGHARRLVGITGQTDLAKALAKAKRERGLSAEFTEAFKEPWSIYTSEDFTGENLNTE